MGVIERKVKESTAVYKREKSTARNRASNDKTTQYCYIAICIVFYVRESSFSNILPLLRKYDSEKVSRVF